MHRKPQLTHCVGSWEPLCIGFLAPTSLPKPTMSGQPTPGLSQCFIFAVTQHHGQLKVVGKPLYPATHTSHPGQYLHLNVQIKTKYTKQPVQLETKGWKCSMVRETIQPYLQTAIIKEDMYADSVNACSSENNKWYEYAA